MLLIALMGFIVLKSDSRSKSNILFFILCLSLIIWLFFLFFAYYIAAFSYEFSLFSVKISWAASFVILPLVIAFLYNFPRVTFKISESKKVIFYAYVTLFSSLIIFTNLLEKNIVIDNGILNEDIFGPIYPLYILSMLVFLVLTVLLFIHKLTHTRGVEKRKIGIAFLGLIFTAAIIIFTNTILPVFDIFYLQPLSVVFVLVLVFSFFYSIQKYRFFDISHFFLSITRKTILALGFILVFLFAYIISTSLISNILPILSGLFAGIFAVFFTLWLNNMFPQLSSKDFREFKSILSELQSNIYYADSYKTLLDLMEDSFVIKLHISKSDLLSVRSKNVRMNIPVYVHNAFIKILEKNVKDILVFDEIEFLNFQENDKKILKDVLSDLKASLCLPLFREAKLIGLFLLGTKENSTPYTGDEIKEILKLKKQIEIAFMNILLKRNMQEENDLMKKIIREKTRQLSKKVKEVKQLVKQQADFIAVTAHEFRTPLSIAMFQLEDTLEKHSHTKQVKSELELLDRSLKNLKYLTEELFQVQQHDLDKVKLNKSKIEIVDYITETFVNFKYPMEEKSISFKLDNNIIGNLFISIDVSQMRQVLNNLLGNALKFSAKNDPKIVLSLDDLGDYILIKVSDNGSGIPDIDKQRIFEKFQTKDSSMGLGLGLGLYLCKRIVELHSGNIWVEDSLLGGASFCIKLKKSTK
jgi:signal transduction histidine kinase